MFQLPGIPAVLCTGAVVGLGFLRLSPAAHAQDITPDTLAIIQVPPITVRVLRDSFSLTDVPFAISIVNQDQIQRARTGVALDVAFRGVPGVQVDNRFNDALGERISIRGFGARAPFGVRGVKVVLDGIPATLPDGQTVLNNVDLGSLGRVEVIRGPSSSLYGNASGGVILFESQLPSNQVFTEEVTFVGGADGLRRLQFKTSGTAGETGYLVNVNARTTDGYREFSEADNLHINGQVRRSTATGELLISGNFVDYEAQNPGSLPDSLFRADPRAAWPGNVAQQTGEKGRQGQAGVVWSGPLRGGGLEIAGFALVRSIDNPIPPRIIELERVAGGARGVYRGQTALGGDLRWTAGVDFELQSDDRLNFENRGGSRGSLTLDQHERVTSLGAYGQVAASLADPVQLLVTVRYDRVDFSVNDALVTEEDPDDSGNRTMDAWSPAIGGLFELAQGHRLYVNLATAFETPTTTELANRPNGAGGFNPDLEPQRTLSAEIGARGQIARRASYDLALFRARVEDALIPFQVADQPGRDFFRNAGSVIHSGFEAVTTLESNLGLRLQVAYTYLNVRFDEFRTADDVFDGNDFPGVTPHRLDLIVGYRLAPGIYADLESRFASRTPADDANSAYASGYTVTDLRGGHDGFDVGEARISPFVGLTNLFNASYVTSVVVNAFGGRYFEPGGGRAAYFGLEVSFPASR